MDVLWAPWRAKYIQSFKDEHKQSEEKTCFLCEAANSEGRDKELLVVSRHEKCFVMLNKFPYNGGHALVAPYRHVGELDELTDEELTNMIFIVRHTVKALQMMSNPHGYNIGVNLGRVAGAGLPGHLHFHIVPRWNGDTSFMAITSDTKVVSQSLEETQVELSAIFQKLKVI